MEENNKNVGEKNSYDNNFDKEKFLEELLRDLWVSNNEGAAVGEKINKKLSEKIESPLDKKYKDTIEKLEKMYSVNKLEKFPNEYLDRLAKRGGIFPWISMFGKSFYSIGAYSAAAGRGLGSLESLPFVGKFFSQFENVLMPIFSTFYLLKLSAMLKNAIKERQMYEEGVAGYKGGAFGRFLGKTDMLMSRMNMMLMQMYALPGIIQSSLGLMGMGGAAHGIINAITPFSSFFNPVNVIGGALLHIPILSSLFSMIPFLSPHIAAYLGYNLIRIPIGFLRQITQITDKKPKLINAYEIEQETSISKQLRPYVIRLISDPEIAKNISPYEMLMLEVMVKIEAHTSIIPLIYNLLHNREELKRYESEVGVDERVKETLYEHQGAANVGIIDKLMDKMENFLFATNPVMQLTEFILHGLTPSQWLRNKNLRHYRKRVIEAAAREYGIAEEHVKIISTPSIELIQGIQDPVSKMVILLQGIYDVLRLQLSELTAIRKGLGIAESFKVEMPQYEEGLSLFKRISKILIETPYEIGLGLSEAIKEIKKEKTIKEKIFKGGIKSIAKLISTSGGAISDLPIIYTYAYMFSNVAKFIPGLKELVPQEFRGIEKKEKKPLIVKFEEAIEKINEKYLEKRNETLNRFLSPEEFIKNTAPQITTQIFENVGIVISDKIDQLIKIQSESLNVELEQLKQLSNLHYLKQIYSLIKLISKQSPISPIPGAPEPELIEQKAVGYYEFINPERVSFKIRKVIKTKLDKIEKEENVQLSPKTKDLLLNMVPYTVGEVIHKTIRSVKRGAPHFEKGGIVKNVSDKLKHVKDSVLAFLTPGEKVISTHEITVQERLQKQKENLFISSTLKMVKLLSLIAKGITEFRKDWKKGLKELSKSFLSGVKKIGKTIKSAIVGDGEKSHGILGMISSAIFGDPAILKSPKKLAKFAMELISKSPFMKFGAGALINGIVGFFTMDDNVDSLHRWLGSIGMAIFGGIGMVLGGGILSFILSLILAPIGKFIGFKIADFLEWAWKKLKGEKDKKKKESEKSQESVAEQLGKYIGEYLIRFIGFIISLPVKILKWMFDLVREFFFGSEKDNKKEQKSLAEKIFDWIITALGKIVKFLLWDLPKWLVIEIIEFLKGLVIGIGKGIWNSLKDIFGSIWDLVKSVWDWLKAGFEWILKLPIKIAEWVWDKIKSLFGFGDSSKQKTEKSKNENIKEILIEKIFNLIFDLFLWIIKLPATIMSKIYEYAKKEFSKLMKEHPLLKKIVDGILFVIKPVIKIARRIFEAIKNIGRFILNIVFKIASIIASIIDGITGVISNVVNAVRNGLIAVAKKIPIVGDKIASKLNQWLPVMPRTHLYEKLKRTFDKLEGKTNSATENIKPAAPTITTPNHIDVNIPNNQSNTNSTEILKTKLIAEKVAHSTSQIVESQYKKFKETVHKTTEKIATHTKEMTTAVISSTSTIAAAITGITEKDLDITFEKVIDSTLKNSVIETSQFIKKYYLFD